MPKWIHPKICSFSLFWMKFFFVCTRYPWPPLLILNSLCCSKSAGSLLLWWFSFPILEYIVLFEGYFSEPVRDVYVSEALSRSSIPSWQIIPRNNPARKFPSDFSLVRVSVLLKHGYYVDRYSIDWIRYHSRANLKFSAQGQKYPLDIALKFGCPWSFLFYYRAKLLRSSRVVIRKVIKSVKLER